MGRHSVVRLSPTMLPKRHAKMKKAEFSEIGDDSDA